MLSPKKDMDAVIAKYGNSIHAILEKESKYDVYQLLGAVEVLVEVKLFQKLPTSPAERMLFAFKWLIREVQNGGFHQYFFNSAGDFWDDVLIGLKLINDEDGLKHFQETLSIFENSSPSKDRYTRQDELESLGNDDEDRVWDHFGKMSDLFFREPFPNWDLVYTYVKGHPNEFNFEGIQTPII